METSPAKLKYLVERQRETIRSMNELRKLMSAATEPVELIRAVAGYLKHSFPIALCAVLLVPQRRLLVFPFAAIAQVDLDGAVRTLLAAASASRTGTLDERALERVLFPAPAQGGGPGMRAGYLRSHYAARMAEGAETEGVLGVFSANADAFAEEDRHALDLIADQLRTMLRLAFLLEALRRADRLKTDLLAIISHELRIPLTAISEGVGLVREGSLGPLTADQKDFLDTVYENVQRLGGMVGKVVIATQVLTGQMLVRPEATDLGPVLAQTLARLQGLAQQQGVRVELARAPEALVWPVDAKYLEQALGHLLENALQATPREGAVQVGCAAGPQGLEIRIRDQGPGIPPDQLATLVDRFASVGSINDRKTGGLGLGLFLAKSMIEGHGGTLRLQSEVGRGTTALITLPKPSKS